MTVSQYFSGLFKGIKSLLAGMSVTMRAFFSKKITQQYPENRATLVIPPRFRGNLIMPHDESNEHACTACGICQMNCPNGTIKVVSEMIQTEDGKKKKILSQYFYNLGQCTFCNLCVLTCPSDAIIFDGDFENSIFTRAGLTKQLNHEGSKLREKKKPVPAPASEKPAASVAEKAPAKEETPKAEETKTAEASKVDTKAVADEPKAEVKETPQTDGATPEAKEETKE